MFLLGRSPSVRLCGRRGLFRVSKQSLLTLPPHQTLHTLSTTSWNTEEEGREQCKYRGEGKKGDLGVVCELGMGHPGNKSIADTFLGTHRTSALPLWLPIGWEQPEECIAGCLWKAEATTSSSLIVAQSADCFESEEKGDGARMQKEAHNSASLSHTSSSPSLPTSLSLLFLSSSSPLFSLLPSPPLRSHRLSCNSCISLSAPHL